MSYDITFDGSLVDNRDLVQVSASSSLVRQVVSQTHDPRFEFNGPNGTPIPVVVASTAGTSSVVPPPADALAAKANFDSGGLGSIVTQSTVSTSKYLDVGSVGNGHHELFTSNANTFIGSTNYQLCMHTSNGNISNSQVALQDVYSLLQAPDTYGLVLMGFNASGANIYSALSPDLNNPQSNPNGFTANYTFNVPDLGQATTFFLWGFYITANASPFNTYVRWNASRYTISSNTPVGITPSTPIEGANKTGGTLITPIVQTLQGGSPAISGPANRFGLNVVDGGTTKLAPQFFPSALNSEESSATITEEKEITADDTSLSVEGTGLGGTEKLERGSSVIVEDVTSYEDNV